MKKLIEKKYNKYIIINTIIYIIFIKMNQKIKILLIVILIIISFWSFVFLQNYINNEKTNNNESITDENNEASIKNEDTTDENNSIENEETSLNEYDWSNEDVLSSIEKNINKENEEKTIQEKENEEKVKQLISNYISDINKDENILKYINPNSILKIKNNTKIVHESFNSEEKANFINELKEYWFLQDTFDPNNNSDINNYINFIIKAWAKTNWIITNFEFKKIRHTDDFVIVDIVLHYDNSTDITKDLRIYVDNSNKINISN